MNVSSVLARSVSTTSSTASVSATATTASSVRGAGRGSDDFGVSAAGSFMSQVKSLVEEDPDKAKVVLTELASEVREQAKGASGEEAKRMSELADRLETVAESGDASALAPNGAGGPPPGGPPPGGPPPGGPPPGGPPPGGGSPTSSGTEEEDDDSTTSILASASGSGGTSRALEAYARQARGSEDGQARADALFTSLSASLERLSDTYTAT